MLLIDELDRADEAFEAFLLEVLSDFQVTIPELGTVHAAQPPIVVITSNRTREIHDALKRRCLYHWVGYPVAARNCRSCGRRFRGSARRCRSRSCISCRPAQGGPVQGAGGRRDARLGLALAELDVAALDPASVSDTLGVLLKYQDDIARLEGTKAKELIDEVRAEPEPRSRRGPTMP